MTMTMVTSEMSDAADADLGLEVHVLRPEIWPTGEVSSG